MRVAILGMAFLLLLSGCLDSLPAEQRLRCLDLTEKSYAFVPDCHSEGECFSSLEKRFFSFDQGLFSSGVKQGLFSYENKVALSWLYFNRARDNASRLHVLCGNGNVNADLVFNLNEFMHNLSKAFEFADSANRESFAILVLEKQDLDGEDISLVREEPLFQDLVVIEHNLNSLAGSCPSQESYACFYLDRAKEFASLVELTGFEGNALNEVSFFSLLDSRSGDIADYIGSGLKIPFVGSVLPSLLSFLSNFSTSRSFLDSLEKVPAFEFMQSYSGFAGEENSCLEKFSAMMKDDAAHRAVLVSRSNSLDSLAESGIHEAEESASALLSESYVSFDANFLQRLYSGLGQEGTISTQSFDIRDFGELNEKSGEKISLLKQSLFAIRQKHSLGEISLGERALALKELNSEIVSLKDNLSFMKEEVVQGLVVLCEQRAESISEDVEGAVLPQGFLVKASDMKARVLLRLKMFEKAGSSEEKLVACSSMVEDFSLFSLALEDFEAYSFMEQASLQDCFSFLELVFESNGRNGFELDDFYFRFKELKGIEKPYTDLAGVERLCFTLKHDLEAFLERQPLLEGIRQDFSLAGKLFSSLEGLGVFSGEKLAGFESKLEDFSAFFPGEKILLEKALPVLPNLKESLSEFVSLLEKELDFQLSSGDLKKTELTRVLEASSSRAVLSKQVTLECSKPVLGFPLNVSLLDSEELFFSNVVVLHGSNAVGFSLEKNVVSFEASCRGKDSFEIIFSVKDPVEVSLVLDKELPAGTSKNLFYALRLKNRLPAALEGVEISLKPSLGGKEVPVIGLFDSSGKKAGFSLLPNGEMAFFVPRLLPGQELAYLLSLAVDDNSFVDPDSIQLQGVDSVAIDLVKSIVLEAEKNLSRLEGLFEGFSDGEIISSKYVPPISVSELEKARLDLSKLNSGLENGSYGLDDGLFEAESINSRLKGSLDEIEEDAIVAYNSAVELFNQRGGGDEVKGALDESQKSLLEGNLLGSIVESRKASGMISLAQSPAFDIPILLLPVVAAAVLVFAVRLRKKEKGKQKEALFKSIEKNW